MRACLLPLLATLLFATFSSCNQTGSPASSPRRDDESVLGVLYQQKAAEYRALCFQAYNLARKRIEEAKANKKYKGRRFAVITDLDETILDNSASSAWVYLHDSTSTFDFLKQWWTRGIADSVPGSVSFFNFAYSDSVDIYYISNRTNSSVYLQAAMRNMHDLGFPYTSPGDEGHFLFLDSTAANSSKEGRRKWVEAKDSVILLLGDNLIDLDAAFDGQPMDVRRREVDRLRDSFGARYIIFPNAIYGDWESALYRNFPGSPSLSQKDSIRAAMLDTTEIDPKGHW